MDAWDSPWADDAHQDEDPGHRKTVSTVQDFELFGDGPEAATEHARVDGSLAFTGKLDGSDFGGASIWATDVNELASVDSSSAWASDSTSVPLSGSHHSNVYPGWGDSDIVLGETQIPGSKNIGNTSILTELSSHARHSTTSVTPSTKEFSDDWPHQLQSDWSSTTKPTAEALQTGGCELRSDSPCIEEQSLVSKLPKEKDVETVPTSSQNTKKQFAQGGDLTEATEAVPHTPLFESDESAEVVVTEKPGNEVIDENHQPRILPEEQDDDDDFGDFGDAEEGEIEDVKFETGPEPAPVAAAITDPLSLLDFTIDSSLALKLYPVIQKPCVLPSVGDIISTTSTRKVWYRISRIGTVGKHNSGGGDDYVRVTWSRSKIRADVCDIVNRWVKEGRFSVSDAMGGGRSYGAMFGWGDGASISSKDSGQKGSRSSAPMGLGLVGYKEGTKSTHKASVSISNWDPLASDKSGTSQVVDFGWGSPKVSKQEMTTTKNMASPKKEQILPSALLPTPSHSTSPETTNALAVDTPTKPGPQALNASTVPVQPLRIGAVAPGSIIPETDNWEHFETTPMGEVAAAPKVLYSRHTNQGLVSGPPGGDTWTSLDLLEKGTVSRTHASPSTSLDRDLRNLGLYFDEKPKKPPTVALEFEPTVADDDWGEMINSPATPVNPPPPLLTTTTTNTATITNRRPSTAHGQSNPFGAFEVGVLGFKDVTPFRRDSAPTLFSPINGDFTVSGVVPTAENNSTPAVDWDFSVFESPAKKGVIPTPSAVPQTSMSPGSTLLGGSQILPTEDKVVMDILEGLPDMGYMLS